ncbi:MAG: CHAT domain-containing protein [Pyrinomonadaceae bacterium]
MNRKFRPPVAFLVCTIVFALVFAFASSFGSHAQSASFFAVNADSNKSSAAEARAALNQGRISLRRNRADEALGSLETALKLYTDAGDKSGQAAAQDALGELYERQGQNETALRYYRNAYDSFRAQNESASANLLLAKIGETEFLMGNTAGARTAFAQILGDKKQSSTSKSDSAPNTSGNNASSGAFAKISGLFAGLSCVAPNLSSDSRQPNQPSQPTSPPNEPPFMGHAPRTPGSSGRMDLRVLDQDGNPIKGAQAKLVSKQPAGLPKGFVCDCEKTTDAAGHILMDPLHIGQLKLTVKAAGFIPQEVSVAAEQLAQPVRVTMQAKNAVPKQPAAPPSNPASQAKSAASSAAGLGACSDLYKLFISYATGELGTGRADYLGGQLDSAKAHYENVLAAALNLPGIDKLREARRFRAAARTSLADIAFRQGRFNDALVLYTDAAKGAQADSRLDLTWPAQRGLGHTRLALAAQEQNRSRAAQLRDEALDAYRDALKTIETLFAGSLRADDARSTFLATTKDVYDEAADALAQMALASSPAASTHHASRTIINAPLSGKALERAAEAFRITEEGRARSLLDLIGESHAEITEGVPAELLKRKQEVLNRQQEIAEQLTGATLAGETPKQPVEVLEAELERLATEFDSIENNIRVTSPRYAALTKSQPLTLAQVQQQVLDSGTALLEFNLGNERSYLWAITQKDVALFQLPSREIVNGQAIALRAQIIPAELRRSIVGINTTANQAKESEASESPAAQNAAAYAAAANTLYKTVLEPAASVFADKRLLVVADGALNYVPFEALVTKPASEADYATLPYLIKTNEVIYAPSASVIAAIRQQGGRTRSGGVLLVADPVFDGGDTRVKQAVASAQSANASSTRGLALTSALVDITNSTVVSGLKLVRLNGTRREAEQIAQLARTTGGAADTWLDFSARETEIKKNDIKSYRVVHIATHGLLDAERPQFTGLVLSLVGNSTGDDGFLRTDEIFNLRLGSPLVMLSACETGLGKEKRGEGVIGLTRAFMYAGAPTVGVSLWSVADRSTALLMPDFYKRLLAGNNTVAPPTAMRAAQLALIEKGRYSAPFFWAPFVLNGDWH